MPSEGSSRPGEKAGEKAGDNDAPGGGTSDDERADRNVDISELIRFLATNLVDKADQVHVSFVEERSANVYELEVAEDDLGMVIGRGGKTARALRALVQAVAPKSRKRTMVEILE